MDKFASKRAQAPVLVCGKDGTPLANQEVRMTLKNHQFLFGCGAFESVALMKIQDEGRSKRLAAEKQMIEMEAHLKAKLLELRH